MISVSTQKQDRQGRRTMLILLSVFVLAFQAASAAPPKDLAVGLAAGVGVALDSAHNHLYYVEYNGGTLKRMVLTPACEMAPPGTCAVSTVAGGFTHPEDVALDIAHNMAYVTTRDDAGTTGALWRVNLTTGAKSMVTFNLGAPQQIFLAPSINTAFVVGYDLGRLWRIDLTSGVKTVVIAGLHHPVGLTLNSSFDRAYVGEQDTHNVSEIDVLGGTRIRQLTAGLTAPFFLAWTDPAQTGLYVAERAPANRISRISLVAPGATPVLTGLPPAPSGIALNPLGSVAYFTTDSHLMRAGLAELAMSEPVFLGVGNVPSTSITDGYASTDPGYFFYVKHAPFGGTLNIFGNLNNFKTLGATHYRVLLTEGGVTSPLKLSWNSYRWNAGTSKYDLVPIAPLPGDDRYQIPSEYPASPQLWYPPFLMMQYPSSGSGLVTFKVEIFQKVGAAWNDLTHLLPAAKNQLTLQIDNVPPDADVVSIRQHGSGAVISPCAIVTAAPNSFDFEVKAYDPNHHLYSYSLVAYWGHNGYAPVASDSYASHTNAEGPYLWSGTSSVIVPATGWPANCNCAHTFYLDVWKRTIDGYNRILHRTAHQSITINNTGGVCP
jgi:DNA-binding beta-propeller fold protein YncE